jgi:hypothetical protein
VIHAVKRGKATLDGKPVKVRRDAEGLVVEAPDDGKGHRLVIA